MIIDDFVMLGRTEPTESKKHGIGVCSAGYSRELRQLVRVYPLPWQNRVGSWTKCRIPLRRPKQDSRLESWRIDSGDSAQEALAAVECIGTVKKNDEFDFLASLEVPSIAFLNERRLSLGIVRPKSISGTFRRREGMDPDEQMTLFDRLAPEGPTQRNDLIPQLRFDDVDGLHCLSLLECGCSEYLRKHRDKAEGLWGALNLHRPDFEQLLLVGNQCHNRTSWLVIKTISRKVPTQVTLFDKEAA